MSHCAISGKLLWALDILVSHGPALEQSNWWTPRKGGPRIPGRTMQALVDRDMAAVRLVAGGRVAAITPRGLAYRLRRRARIARRKGKTHAEACPLAAE